MRDIIYRAKRKDNGEWVYGYYFKATHHWHNRGIHKDWIATDTVQNGGWCNVRGKYAVLPETVGQYTGLTDKNGKKIFEGDIVRADDYVFSIKYGKCGGTPNADNYGYMGFYLEAVSEGTKLCAHYGLRDDICYFTDIEVIDNIHDNKLFLEVK